MMVEVDGVRRKSGHYVARVLVALAIGVHFLLIVAQVTGLELGARPVAAYYRALTFANRNFRFFAPTVAPDRVLRIEVIDRSGAARPYRFDVAGRELELRMQAMLDRFSESPEAMHTYARSWAALVFRADPRLSRVIIEVTQNVLPSLPEYRAGARLRVEPVFRSSFER
jgi:hypothetical protein